MGRGSLPPKRALVREGTRLNERPGWLWVRTRDGAPLLDRHLRSLESEARLAIDVHGPVYRLEGVAGDRGLYCPLPHVLVVRPREGLSLPQRRRLEALLRQHGLVEVKAKSRYLGPFRYFRLRKSKARGSNATKAVLERVGKSLIGDVSLVLMPMLRPVHFVPNDTHYGRQWNLETIGVEGAWDIAKGIPSVVVAVLDGGCELSHPDLEFVSDGINLGTMSGTGLRGSIGGSPMRTARAALASSPPVSTTRVGSRASPADAASSLLPLWTGRRRRGP